MELVSTFAERIGSYRTKYDYTLAAFSEVLGIPAQTLNRYELAQRVPKVDTVNKIAERLGLNPLWLQGYNVSMSLEDFAEDSDLNEYLEQLKNREEMRRLFAVASSASKLTIEQMIKVITALSEVQ
jgi:transcriptional regulator with XRE-family HTH domain